MITCKLIAEIGAIPLAVLSIIIALASISDDVVKNPRRNEKLLLLQVIFSNGEQEQEQDVEAVLPSSPADSDIYWLNESSVLSLRGQKRAYKLGKSLKNIYQLYLQNYAFTPALVHSTTGYLNVLQATLQCVHAGLFPTVPGAQIININLDWRPIPYDVLPKQDDVYICQEQLRTDIRLLSLDALDDNAEKVHLRNTMDNISSIVGYNVTLSDCVVINDYLSENVRNFGHYGLLSPGSAWSDIWPVNSQALVDIFWDAFAESAKFSAVPLFNMFLKNFKDKMDGHLPGERKLHLFSAHRLNIAAILSALGGWGSKNGTITPCSYILMELTQEIETNYYNIYFYFGNGAYPEKPTQFTPYSCTGESCTVFEFTKIVNNLTLP